MFLKNDFVSKLIKSYPSSKKGLIFVNKRKHK